MASLIRWLRPDVHVSFLMFSYHDETMELMFHILHENISETFIDFFLEHVQTPRMSVPYDHSLLKSILESVQPWDTIFEAI